MIKAITGALLVLIFAPSSYALLDATDMNPTTYFLIPQAGYHIGYSELAGSNSVSHGPIIGAGLRIEKDHFFFTPDFSLQAVIGLDQSPLTIWGLGFVAGGRLPFPAIDIFAGVTYRSMLAYKVQGTVMGRLGGAFNLGLSEFQIWFQGLIGQYSERTLTKVIDYPYLAIEGGIQFPIEL